MNIIRVTFEYQIETDMEIIKTYTDSENIEYSVFNDGKFKFKMKDLDAGEVISLIYCPTLEMAVGIYNEIVSKIAKP